MATTTSIQNLLSFVYLTKGVKVRSSKVVNPFPAEFWNEEKVPGAVARVPQEYGTRRAARISAYGSTGRRRTMAPIQMQDHVLYSVFEETLMSPALLNQLRSPGTYDHDLAVTEVERQVEVARDELQNTRVGCLASLLNQGNTYFDIDGNLLTSSSGSSFTLSAQLAANNQNQLNGIIDTKWPTTTADIPTQIRNLRKQSATDTGYDIEYAFYGKSAPSYMSQNTYVKEFWYRANQGAMGADYLSNPEIPDGFLGIKKWIPAYKCVYDKYDGTKASLFGDDTVTFTVNPQYWYKLFAGTRLVPKSIGIYKDMTQALGNLTEAMGMFAYAYLDPRTIELFMMTGDVCLPAVVNNLGVYNATVNF